MALKRFTSCTSTHFRGASFGFLRICCVFLIAAASLARAAVEGTAVEFPGFSRHTPQDLTHVVGVAAGGFESLVVKSDGSVLSWSGLDRPKPALSNVVQVSVGEFHSVALRADGTVVAWGSLSPRNNVVTNIPPSFTNVVQISAGNHATVALQADGTVVAWGDTAVTNVPIGLTNITAVSAGSRYALALAADGQVIGWGEAAESLTVPSWLTNVLAISAGSSAGVAVQPNGDITVWGLNRSTSVISLPGVIAVDAGTFRIVALKADGTLWECPAFIVEPVLPREIEGISGVTAFSARGFPSVLALVGGGLKAPIITWQPSGDIVATERSFELSTRAAGTGAVSYQWFKDGQQIAGATNEIYSVTNAALAHQGYYHAIASDSTGSTATRTTFMAIADSIFTSGFAQSADYISTSGFRLNLRLKEGSHFRLQSSQNLRDWADVTNLVGSADTTYFWDSNAKTDVRRFYRTVSP